MKKRLFMLFVPVVVASLVAGCGGGDDTMEPQPPAVEAPPDLSGTYSLQSLLQGGLTVQPPLAMGTFSLTQTSVSGEVATGNLSLRVEVPSFGILVEDSGTYTVRSDGSWEQMGETGQAVGTYTLAGNVLTVIVTEPPPAVSTTVWQRQ